MLVLGIETATRGASVGVVRIEAGEGGWSTLAEAQNPPGRRTAESLLGAIDECLERAGVPLQAIDGVAVSIGPGSFTGLRVGLATAKGFTIAGRPWLVGVPTLEALATAIVARDRPGFGRPVEPGDLVCVCLDARRGEVYAALFAVVESAGVLGIERLVADGVHSPDALVARLTMDHGRAVSHHRRVHVLGDGVERYGTQILPEPRAHVVPSPEITPRGAVVAALGHRVFAREGAADVAALVPFYLQRPALGGPSRAVAGLK